MTRVHQATCHVYGRSGWSGFTIDAVAREAAVGKASIYSRWSSKEDLLTESLAAQLAFSSDVDTGDVRTDLTYLAKDIFRFHTGEYGDAALRLMAEARLNPELAARFEEFRTDAIRAARKVVKRGIVRGQLPADTDVSSLLVAVFGGVIMHVVATPTAPSRRRHAATEREVERLVDFALSSASPTRS